MDNEDFLLLLSEYLEPPADPNPELAVVKIVWVRDNPNFGALHIQEKHGITEEEVEQVLLEIPPFVEAVRHPDYPDRTAFWGATRFDRWIFVVCEDWEGSEIRHLRPITAFEPDEGEAYWRNR